MSAITTQDEATWSTYFWKEAGPLMFDGPYPPDNLVHHYTTLEAAISIIENQSLWLSNIAFLNDSNEVVCARNVLNNAVLEANDLEFFTPSCSMESARDIIRLLLDIMWESEHATFVSSFCEHGDLLGQWRGYGGGVSIAFDATELTGCFARNEQDPHNYIRLERVIYDAKTQAKILDSLIYSANQWITSHNDILDFNALRNDTISCVKLYFQNIAAKMKNFSFREEQEWRLIATRSNASMSDTPEVKFRTRARGITPYIELKATNGLLPIRKMVVAPNAHPSVGPALTALLLKKGYQNIPVDPSHIPFRD